MRLSPPRWSVDQLEVGRLRSMELFREQRMAEPLEDYLQHFQEVRSTVEKLLDETVDLSRLPTRAVPILSDRSLQEVVRYLAGPPISADDLRVVADAKLSPSALWADNQMAQRVIETILLGLDRQRFPWVSEDRAPTDTEKAVAIMSTAALVAARRVMTARANESKTEQEQKVKDALKAAGFLEVAPREISTLHSAPAAGEYCGESLFGTRKADIVIRLWDHRVMALECKVSNSSTNSVKRLNNDAAVKAGVWIGEFGTAQTVPAAVLAGVFKRHNLEQAQERGLAIWWSHDLNQMVTWIEQTRH
ncbi:MAG: XamI family restriction endonuclease [Pseudonocardiales bacterium]|nr:XamI family restriction endonuclease [Pseudonocardiales bacterium]